MEIMNLRSRRKWIAGMGLLAPWSAFGYGSLIEKRQLSVTRQEITLAPEHGALDGLRLAVMGDFHHDDFGDDGLVAGAVEGVNRAEVDLAILTGDYISEDPRALEPLCEALSGLRTRLGTFAVLGNHDCWHPAKNLPSLLRQAGITLLINEIAEFSGFAVAGFDSAWGGRPDAGGTLARLAADKPVILGWHEPDTFDSLRDRRVALQVSGHTHGGQICAPFYGPLKLPLYGKKYPYGLYQKEGRSLFVTRGIGTLSVPARFLCPPEVAILTLRRLTSPSGKGI